MQVEPKRRRGELAAAASRSGWPTLRQRRVEADVVQEEVEPARFAVADGDAVGRQRGDLDGPAPTRRDVAVEQRVVQPVCAGRR